MKIKENIRQYQTYINSIDICKDNVRLNVVDVKLNESIFSILNKVYNIIGTIISKKMENKLLKEKPKVIFFDLSSTILDSHRIDLESINFVLTKYGMPTWEGGTRLKKDKAKSMKENFPNFFGEEIAEQAYQEYLRLLIDNIDRMPLIPNIEATLNYCRENGIKAVIVSNRDNIFVEKFLDIFGFRKYFDSILTPETTGYTKPNPMIINQYLLKNSLDPKSDTILFMGDAFADVRCAFRSGCIPILYTEIARDEISPKNLERLSKINPDNPTRIISTQRQFIDLLEKSRAIWDEKPRTKITYIGAGGKIGKKAIQDICNMAPANENVELVLIGSGSEDSLIRLSGFVKDVIGSLEIVGKGSNIRFIITNDYSKTKNSNIVICSAAKWPNEEEKARLKKIDPSGRNAQSLVNAEMIKKIFMQLNTFCPKALALILTNQVDMMCHISRSIAKDMNIIGLSGAVDSTRLRQNIKSEIGLSSNGLMIGYHNSSMTPILKSLTMSTGKNIFPVISGDVKFSDSGLEKEFKEAERKKLESIVSATRRMGGEISAQQRAGLHSNTDTGASMLPSAAIVRLVSDFCFGIGTHTESYNVFISNPEIAHHYGVAPNTELSIPLKIGKGRIEQTSDLPLLETEKLKMREAQQKLDKQMAEIFGAGKKL